MADTRDFYLGFGMAIGALARDHDQPGMAVDIMRSNGVSLKELEDAGVEAFDLEPIAKEWNRG